MVVWLELLPDVIWVQWPLLANAGNTSGDRAEIYIPFWEERVDAQGIVRSAERVQETAPDAIIPIEIDHFLQDADLEALDTRDMLMASSKVDDVCDVEVDPRHVGYRVGR